MHREKKNKVNRDRRAATKNKHAQNPEMSCSKLSYDFTPTRPTRMHSPRRDSVTGMLSPFDKPYTQVQTVCLFEHGEEEDEIYIVLDFQTPNKKEINKTAMLSVWRILYNPDEDVPHLRTVPDETTVFGEDEKKLSIIKCKVTIDWILKQEKAHVALPFTTNDPAKLDSFTPGLRSKQYNERYVMCLGKSRFSEEHSKIDPRYPYEVAMSSPRVSPDMLNAVLERRGDDTRFLKRATPADATKDELKAIKKEALAEARAKIEALGHEKFCELYRAWLQLNETLPKTTRPEIFKDDVGGNVLMTAGMVETWNRLSPLLFVYTESKCIRENPANCAVFATCDRQTWIAEVTPKDQRWGVSPKDGNELGWCASTPEGLKWLIETSKTHGEEQERFLAKLQEACHTANGCKIGNPELHKAKIEEAFTMLTDGLNGYKFGILGLTKAMLLMLSRGELVFPVALHYHIDALFRSNGVGGWWLRELSFEFDDDEMDPFALMRSVGSEPR